MDYLITCENLVKIYQLDGVEVMALQGLDLHIKRGEVVGIIGASGSGKTTLLNVLGGLDRPSAGKVQVETYDLLKLSESQLDQYRRQMVGFLWQQTSRNLLPYLTAQENITLPMWLAGCPRSERIKRAEELLDALGLIARSHHLPVQLSGGEQQRVAIAVALANQPLLLLADEPTGEVDSATAKEVYSYLHKMNETHGMTTIIVSHDPQLNQYTDRVVTIRDGKTSTESIRSASGTDQVRLDEHGISRQGSRAESHVVRSPGTDDRAGFEELVVLDKAGRLQIPKHVLESLDIGDRVRLEVTDGSVMIHPVAGRGRKPVKLDDVELQDALYALEDPEPDEFKLPILTRVKQAFSGQLSRNRLVQWWHHRRYDGK